MASEMKKKTITEAADSLALLALGLRNGDYMSAADIASAIDRHVSQLKQACDGDATAATDAAVERRGQDEDAAQKRGSVGLRSNANAVLAWCFAERLSVVVSGHRLGTDNSWMLEVRSAGMLRACTTVFGGRATAAKFARYLRDGMVGRAMRLKKTHAKRAFALSPEAKAELAATVARQNGEA